MKKILSFIIVLTLSLSLCSLTGCSLFQKNNSDDDDSGKIVVNGLTIENGVVTKYEPTSDSGVELVIPEKAGGVYVSEIAKEVFRDCKAIKTVSIPASMKKIGKNAFRNCSNLEGVYITDVAGWAGIAFDEIYSNPIMNEKCQKLYLNGELLETLSFPAHVTRIEPYTFYMCLSLKKITISYNINFIGKLAFVGVTSTLEEFAFEDPYDWTGGSTIPYTGLQKRFPIENDRGYGCSISCYNHFGQFDWVKK